MCGFRSSWGTSPTKERMQAGRAALGMHVGCLQTRAALVAVALRTAWQTKLYGCGSCRRRNHSHSEEAYVRSMMPVHRARMDVATRITALRLFHSSVAGGCTAQGGSIRDAAQVREGECIFRQNTRADVLLLIRNGGAARVPTVLWRPSRIRGRYDGTANGRGTGRAGRR